MNCDWAEWQDETICSKSCGFGARTGTKSQRRAKVVEENRYGSCTGAANRTIQCTTRVPCPGILNPKILNLTFRRLLVVCLIYFVTLKIIAKNVANCLWGDWSDESACSKTCGFGGAAGVKYHGRVKLQEEDHGGTCIGNSTRLSACYPNTNCPSRLTLFP